MTLSYVNILVDSLLPAIRFLVLEHVVDDLDELPREGIHGLPVGFALSSLSPVVLTGLGIDSDLGQGDKVENAFEPPAEPLPAFRFDLRCPTLPHHGTHATVGGETAFVLKPLDVSDLAQES